MGSGICDVIVMVIKHISHNVITLIQFALPQYEIMMCDLKIKKYIHLFKKMM